MHERNFIIAIIHRHLTTIVYGRKRVIVGYEFLKTLIVILIAFILLIVLDIHYLVIVLKEFHSIELELML